MSDVPRVCAKFLAQFEHVIHYARKTNEIFVSLRENATFSPPLPPVQCWKVTERLSASQMFI